MQIKNIECSKYNNYNFYSLIIEFDNIFGFFHFNALFMNKNI